ncbi:MAG: hypothetical protein ACREQI_02450 [Candidatus Binataceae bacterium]
MRAEEMNADPDRILDSVLLLYFLKGAAPIYGRTKMQKTIFLVEMRLREKGLTASHFRFFRHNNGPFSPQVWDQADRLCERGQLSRGNLNPTSEGEFILDLAMPELKKLNPKAFEIIDRELAYCKSRTGEALMKQVYKIDLIPDEMPARRMKVEDIPFGIDIIVPKQGGLKIPADLLEVLREQLAVTPAQLEAARARMPILERRAIRNLTEALSEAPPS